MTYLSSPSAQRRRPFFFLFFFVISGAIFVCSSETADTLNSANSLKDGAVLLSDGGSFELGFFGLGRGSVNKYLCVRSTKGTEKPIVWVANRRRPLKDSTGILRFQPDGNLVVLDGTSDVLWTTKLLPSTIGDRAARLLESGNLVVSENGYFDIDRSGTVLWQSFDEPGDTLLPTMKLLVNSRTGENRHLTSWKSDDDPSPGNFSYRLDVSHMLPSFLLYNGSTLMATTGFFNGVRFTGYHSMNANGIFNSTVISSGDETYYTDTIIENSSRLILRLQPQGTLRRILWREETGIWSILWTVPKECDQYAICGSFGTCVENVFPLCSCLTGFQPRSPEEWSTGQATGGCLRTNSPSCGGGDFFERVRQVKLPVLDNATVDMDISLDKCREKCQGNCSCTAYASADVRGGGRGCITWFGDLVDMKNISYSVSQEFFVRISASGAASEKRKGKQLGMILGASISVAAALLLLLLCLVYGSRKRVKEATGSKRSQSNDGKIPVFDFETITTATRNFSNDNRIGEGGFGVVYKGVLEDGQQIAVKRLSSTSTQGVQEFMNEVKLIAKLQHKNLVRLLGCCTHGDEKMLVFDYMRNQSLDLFIFDETRRSQLGWKMRLDIILGIARGLLYIHHDSRLKIVHRDLKPSNILLDEAWNPKISDFGTARIFGADQHADSTRRVIGTYGYMSPEYALNGIISTKSDVFSFGVIALEVLSGIKSRGIFETGPHLNLLSLAWASWQDGNCLQLLDRSVPNPTHESDHQLSRCIQVGLLCVQEHARDRPNMCDVVTMLCSESSSLPHPTRPGFLLLRNPISTEISTSFNEGSCSPNGLTYTNVIGR